LYLLFLVLPLRLVLVHDLGASWRDSLLPWRDRTYLVPCLSPFLVLLSYHYDSRGEWQHDDIQQQLE
jgi:hypothetical protein